jgi:hypothetical protein
MKVLLCIFCVLSFCSGYAQNKIFYSSDDVMNTVEETHSIDKVRIPWGRLGKSILVKYADGCEASFGKKAIWGFEKDGRKLRLYEGEIFEIVDSGAIVLYKTFSPHPVYYFSEDFNANVVLLATGKLKKVLNDRKLVEAYKQFKIIREIL